MLDVSKCWTSHTHKTHYSEMTKIPKCPSFGVSEWATNHTRVKLSYDLNIINFHMNLPMVEILDAKHLKCAKGIQMLIESMKGDSTNHHTLHNTWYLVWLTDQSYMFLYIFTIDVLFKPSKDVDVLYGSNNQFDHSKTIEMHSRQL